MISSCTVQKFCVVYIAQRRKHANAISAVPKNMQNKRFEQMALYFLFDAIEKDYWMSLCDSLYSETKQN